MFPTRRPQQGREVVAEWAASRFAGQLVLAVQLARGSPVVGEVVLKWASQAARQAEVGYIFHADYSGHGYATEAARAILSVGFTEFGFHRIFARLDAENTAPASVCRRLGMRQEAHLDRKRLLRGTVGQRTGLRDLAPGVGSHPVGQAVTRA